MHALDRHRADNDAPESRVDDDAPVMTWAARPDLSCESVNRAWLEFTGYTREQALGEGWSRTLHPEDLARWLDTCVRAFDTRASFEIEYRMRRRDGEYRWVLDRGRPRISRDGQFLGYAGACIDIDARRRAEQELARSLERERRLRLAVEEASRAKNGYLASVLQELRAPVQAIVAWTAHLRAQAKPESEAASSLAAIETSARVQQRVLGNLLALSDRSEPLLAGVRVLVVEDDQQARDSIVKVLQAAGAETRAAASSAEALEALEAWHADVVLGDTALRGGGGFALIRALRALPAERGGCTRAAALTGAAEPREARRAMAAGYDAQLAKPVEPV
ncbi:MAG TPA: PAS domain-containing protein, partial [Burkholderiales bacterium]|nr:PAS domain-containing protein [Burkholderiales bacterium]